MTTIDTISRLTRALKTIRSLVEESAGVPRYSVSSGAALNSVIEENVDPAIREGTALLDDWWQWNKSPYIRPGLSFAVGKVIEEAGELQASLGKTIRWGWHSKNPELPPADQVTNRDWVLAEIRDARFALDRLEHEIRKIDPRQPLPRVEV